MTIDTVFPGVLWDFEAVVVGTAMHHFIVHERIIFFISERLTPVFDDLSRHDISKSNSMFFNKKICCSLNETIDEKFARRNSSAICVLILDVMIRESYGTCT